MSRWAGRGLNASPAMQNIRRCSCPFHHASHGLPSPLSRGRMEQASSFSRCIGIGAVLTVGNGFASNEAFHFCFPKKEGKRSADWRVTRELHPLPGTAEILLTRTPRLSALHCGLPRLSSRPGPGQRFLESPDANGWSAHPLRHQCSRHPTVRTRAGRA